MRFKNRDDDFMDDGFNSDTEQYIKTNRISSIDSEQQSKKAFPFKPILILLGLVAVLFAAIFIAIKFSSRDSQITSDDIKKITNLPFDAFEKDTQVVSDNINLKNGIDSYKRGYFSDAITEFNKVVESDAIDKDKAIALNFIGSIKDEQGNYDEAITTFQRALNYDSKNPDIFKNLSLAYRHKKDYGKAINSAEKSLSLRENDVNSQLLLGNIYFEQGKYDEAIEKYDEILKRNPQNAAIHYNKATALLKKGKEFAAIEHFEQAGAIDKIGEIAHRSYGRLGVLYTQRNSFENAEKYLRKAVDIRPQNAINRYNLGIAYLRQKKTNLALGEFTKAEEFGGKNSAMLENLGDAYLSLKDYDKSLAVYNKLLKTTGRNIRILSSIGEIYYHQGHLDKALNVFKKITTYEPTTENARIAYLNMGNILTDSERFNEAIEMYNKALTISSKDDSALYNLGFAYKGAGHPEKAIITWKKAIQLNPNKPKHRMVIANYYYERKFYDEAEKEYSNILSKWPQIQEGHYKMATIYFKRGSYDYALKAYDRVININNRTDFARTALINKAILYGKIHKNDKALKRSLNMIQKALLLKPRDADALYARGIILTRQQNYQGAIDTFHQALPQTRDSKLLSKIYNSIGRAYYKQGKEVRSDRLGMYKKALRAFTRGVEEDPLNEQIRLNRKVAMDAYETEISRDR